MDQSIPSRSHCSVNGAALYDPLRSGLEHALPDHSIELGRMEGGSLDLGSSHRNRRGAEVRQLEVDQ